MVRQAVEPKYAETISFAKLEPGTVLEGRFVQMRSIKTKQGRDANVYEFKLNGEKFEVFGVAALDSRMSLIAPGQYTWITYRGKTKGNNGNVRHDIVVESDPDDNETPL